MIAEYGGLAVTQIKERKKETKENRQRWIHTYLDRMSISLDVRFQS